MANCAFGWPIYSDTGVTYTPSLSGGSWSGSLPLTNLKDRRLAKVARSADALAASTQFIVDLGVARAIGVLALPSHNLSVNATVQWQGGTSSGGAQVYDSTALAVSFSASTAEIMDGINFPVVHIPASAQSARYWTCKVVDTANTDGYVELGRVVIAGIYQPAVNMSIGAKNGLQTDTERKSTDGGADIYNVKAIRRSWDFALDLIAESEAQTQTWRMQRLLGVSGQVMFVFNTADTTYLHERSFLATLEELGGLTYPYVIARNQTPFRVREVL